MRKKLWAFLFVAVLLVIYIVYLTVPGLSAPVQSVEIGYIGLQNFSEGLAAVKNDTQHDDYGFINRSGDIVFHGDFDYIGSFSEGLALAQRVDKETRGYLFGYVDVNGNVAISFQFNDAKAFSEGLAAINLQGRYGYIDQSGKIIIQPQFDDAYPFSGGLAKIIMEGRCGFIDKKGKLIVEPHFYRAGSFSDGLAPVADKTKFGYADPSGKIVIDLEFDDAKSFSDGLAPVKVGKKWKYIHKDGSFLSAEKFDEARTFSEGLAVVGVIRTNFYDRHFGGYSGTRMAYGFIDHTGQYVIKPKFLAAESFSDGLSRVSIPAGDWFGEIEDYIFINQQEKRVSQRLEYALPFKDGLALVEKKNHTFGFINTKGRFVFKFDTKGNVYPAHSTPVKRKRYGFIDTNGNVVIHPRFYNARPFSDGLAYADEGKRGFINKKGEWVIKLSGNMLPLDFSEGLAAVDVHDSKKGGSLSGYIDKSGRFAIEPQFYKARKFVNNIAPVKLIDDYGNSWGYIDRSGEVRIPAQYHAAGYFYNAVAFVEYIKPTGPGQGGQIHYRFIDNTGQTSISVAQAPFNLYSSQGFPRIDDDHTWTEARFDLEAYFSFTQPLIPVRSKNPPYKVGYIDLTGEFIISPAFEDGKPFSEGLAPVKINQQWGYIDLNGKLVIQPSYDGAQPFSGQRALIEKNAKWGYIDPSGTIVSEPQLFEAAYSFRERLALVKMNGKYGFIDPAGQFIIDPQYHSARSFSEGLALISVMEYEKK